MRDTAWQALEETIGIRFRDRSLLKLAMTHSTYAHENPGTASNERLEFLGDAVLQLAASTELYEKYKGLEEGKLSKRRASIVCEQNLAAIAEGLSLGDCLLLGRGEERTGGRKKPSILADAVEALIGAVYLDRGFAGARELVQRFIMPSSGEDGIFFDSKSTLQEVIQNDLSKELSYRLILEEGPEHDKLFTMEALLNGKAVGKGQGKSKKAAEQAAAEDALEHLGKE